MLSTDRHRFYCWISIALSLALGVFAVSSITAQEEEKVPTLFEAIDLKAADLTPKQETILNKLKEGRTSLGVTVVRINDAAFQAESLQFNLSDSISPELKRARIHKLAGDSFTWTGAAEEDSNKSADEPVRFAKFYVEGNRKIGSYQQGDYIYSVRPIGGGLHALIKNDPKKVPADEPEAFKEIERDAEKKEAPLNKADKADSPPAADAAPPTIRVLMAYTPAVAAAQDNVQSFVNALIALTNDTFTQSNIPCKLELAHAGATNYTESGSVVKDINALQSTNDGAMDEVHALRDKHKADVVMMLIDEADYAGYAAAILAESDSAFAIADDSYADWYFTFAHELGHLLGCRHDPAADGSNSPFSYGHGYQDGANNFRTIMAYNCPGGCTRVGIWSSPQNNHNGHPAGTAGLHDNARVIRETAATIAAFR